jgi:hypothetical protein
MECEFCKKVLSTKSNLNLHQKTAKYCIALQNKEDLQINLNCKFCNLEFTRKSILDNHLISCKNKKENEIKAEYEKKINDLELNHNKEIENLKLENIYYKQQIENLNDRIQEITLTSIQQPTNNNTITNNNSLTDNSVKKVTCRYQNILAPINSLTDEYIKQVIDQHYNENIFYQGQKGLARFCVKYFVKTSDNKLLLVCSDPSRKVFLYLDENGNICKDIKALKFTEKFIQPFKDKNKEIYEKIFDKCNIWIENKNDPDADWLYDEERLAYAQDKLNQNTSLDLDNNDFVNNLIPLTSSSNDILSIENKN